MIICACKCIFYFNKYLNILQMDFLHTCVKCGPQHSVSMLIGSVSALTCTWPISDFWGFAWVLLKEECGLFSNIPIPPPFPPSPHTLTNVLLNNSAVFARNLKSLQNKLCLCELTKQSSPRKLTFIG